MPDPRHDLGLRAEAAVAAWLEGDGWTVLARRWRVPEGELDLVCLDRAGALVGVEVRARRTRRSGSPLESVDRRRIGRLRRALARYAAAMSGRHDGTRLDLVSVTPAAEGRWLLRRYPALDAW
ncbi:MAG TPA: YraN family protein [Candidatus Limnocylindria bacterium]|jgi:putative endonuclease|nr:YraN family protein [Candidatus Limnocylindria bacterium]